MDLKQVKGTDEVLTGNVYVMTHSFFSDVIRIGCTPDDTEEYAQILSSRSPGEYTVFFSLTCIEPCKTQQKIREYLKADEYINEFYRVSPNIAKNLLKQEALRIPTRDM